MRAESTNTHQHGYEKPAVEETVEVVALLTGKHGPPGGGGGHS